MENTPHVVVEVLRLEGTTGEAYDMFNTIGSRATKQGQHDADRT